MAGTKGTDVKETIIRESIKLFLSKGYRGTSIKAIMEAVNVGSGTIYWYFKSKEEILINIVQKFEKELVEGLIHAVSNREGDFARKYRALHRYTTEYARDNKELSIVFFALLNEIVGTETEAEKEVKRIYERFRSFVESMLEDGKKDGSVRQDVNAPAFAHIIIASHMGMVEEWHVYENNFDVAFFTRSFRDLLIKSITS